MTEEVKSPELENSEAQQTVVPTEVEDSSTYDPFKAAKEMDDAVIAGRDGEGDKTPAQEAKAPETATSETEKPSEEKPPVLEEGKSYTPEELAELEALARKGYEYDTYFKSPEGREVVKRMWGHDRAKEREKELATLDKEARWKKLNEDMYGDYAPDYMTEFDDKVSRMIDQRIANKLGGALREVEMTKQTRIAREKERLTAGFAEHIQQAYGMEPDEARNIASLAMRELDQKMPHFDPQAYGVELAVFADTELASVNAGMLKKQREENETLKAKIAEYEAGAQKAPQSTTAIAAERALGSRDADYKRGGGIPTGRGGVNDNVESEDEQALNFFHGR